jgi:hypothetical protein
MASKVCCIAVLALALVSCSSGPGWAEAGIRDAWISSDGLSVHLYVSAGRVNEFEVEVAELASEVEVAVRSRASDGPNSAVLELVDVQFRLRSPLGGRALTRFDKSPILVLPSQFAEAIIVKHVKVSRKE